MSAPLGESLSPSLSISLQFERYEIVNFGQNL